MAGQPSRSQASLDILDQSVNDVLIHVGKAIRAHGKNGRKTVGALSAAKINEANIMFNASLDSIETEIRVEEIKKEEDKDNSRFTQDQIANFRQLRARATLRRDLEQLRAKKSANGSVGAAPRQESYAGGTQSFHQAPAAAMDIDSEETRPSGAGSDPAGFAGVKIKSETGSDQTMAPYPNMDLDSPTATTAVSATNMSRPAASKLPQAPQPVKSPIAKKETPMRSPQHTAKPAPIPGGAAAVTGKKTAGKKATSPAATRIPSPAASRSTVSPVATKVPSPILVKSAAASPAVVKASVSQSPTPTPNTATAGANRAVSLSSSSSSPSVTITSPVLSKKAAAAKTAPKSTTPVPVPRIPVPATAPPSLPAYTMQTTTAGAAPVPAMHTSNDVNMDDLFILSGQPGPDGPTNSDLGFTNMQFSLIPEDTGDTAQQQPPRQQQNQRQQQPPASRAAPAGPGAVSHQTDDSDFDVDKFVADAAQNLMMDTAFSTAPAGVMNGFQQHNQQGQHNQPQQQQPQQQQQQPQANDMLMSGTGPADAATDNGDDLFKFIDDDGVDGLGDDPTTNFDELYMDNTDSIDIDNYFDTA